MVVRQVRFAETKTPSGDLAETLSRVYVHDEKQTAYLCCMIELPDRDNETNISRIPAGTYVLEKLDSSPAFDYPHLWVHDPGEHDAATREGIKWHIANYARQLRGCGAPGQAFVDIDGDGILDVTRSEDTLNDLLDVLPQRAELEIINNDDPNEVEGAGLDRIATESLVSKVHNLSIQ